ncbi:transposable element Tcb2 transposase [Trichonephila clavipes]|nr:transposable element Tcb2 transposase [Trichonephila clavipes]
MPLSSPNGCRLPAQHTASSEVADKGITLHRAKTKRVEEKLTSYEECFIYPKGSAGYHGWFVPGPRHQRLRVQSRLQSVEFHDVENRQRSCMIIRHCYISAIERLPKEVANAWEDLAMNIAQKIETIKNSVRELLNQHKELLENFQLLLTIPGIGEETAIAILAEVSDIEIFLDAFTRGRIIGKLKEGCSKTSVAAEFGIDHSIVSRLWRQFQTTGTAIRGFSSGRPRGTTPTDDRYIVLQVRRNRWQTAGEIARHTTQATGRPVSRFTVARILQGGGLFARRPVRCVALTPAHRRRRSLRCREHRNWRDNEWGRVLFTDESRFSLSSDSHRILIWKERESRNHPSNIIEMDRYGGHGVLAWGGIMLGSRTDLHIIDAGSVNGTRY